MDQDSTKDTVGGSDRRNWRERLGVGQDLPKISDEFQTLHSDPKPSDEHCQSADSSESQSSGPAVDKSGAAPGALPGKPVARPAPMAPRYSRPAATPSDSGGSSAPEAQGPKAAEARARAASPGVRPWAMSSQSTQKRPDIGHQRPVVHLGETVRPGAMQATPSAAGKPTAGQRPGHPLRTSPAPGPQRPVPTRGPAAYAQAAQRPRAPAPAPGGDSFSERLRAQREAAERLAQQRLAAARERLSQTGSDPHSSAGQRKLEPASLATAMPHREAHGPAKPKSAEQPRFTFADEEIVAAQQETGLLAEPQPPADAPQHDSPAPPPRSAPAPHPSLEAYAAGAPEHRAEYRHHDESMFEDEQPVVHGVPPRASAADYSAAYREFEDEFEEETGRRRGPLLLTVSLAVVAVVAGGLIYGYQQMGGSPAPETVDLPVISAPQEPAKAEPAPPVQQPQQAAIPARRKQIYDRIIGEETLEPERIVPTEEEPRLQDIQQPNSQQPRASGLDDPEAPGTAGESQSTEPLPLPLPPPPGAGQQGDLLIPGIAGTRIASASPELPELTLPEPVSASSPSDSNTTPVAAIHPTSDDPSPDFPEPGASTEAADTAATPEFEATEPGPMVRTSIYPEPTEPLAYPDHTAASPADEEARQADETRIAAIAEPQPEPDEAQVEELQADPAEQPAPDMPVEAEQASDVPLPRAKPEPPVRIRTAAKEPSEPEARTPQPSGGGPVQIVPADIASGQAPAQALAARQPQVQEAPRRRTVGREYDPLYGSRSSYSGSSSLDPSQPAATQQVAAVAPDSASREAQSTGGYIVQLASFRTEAQALGEYQRLVQKYPQMVGDLDSRIEEASLGQSGAFYRLGIGPLPDRSAATRLCDNLIAAGEKDCLVRRQ